MSKVPTILDVAKACGYSKSTVSLVIRNSDEIPDSTKAAVRSAMKRIGYRYNHCAGALRVRYQGTGGRSDDRCHRPQAGGGRAAFLFSLAGDSWDAGGSMASNELLARIGAGKAAVLAQTGFMHREFGRVKSEWKHDGTRVTAADLAISEKIFKELAAQFPEDHLLSEELAETDRPIPVTHRFAWVLDPIDGTNNYATGIPYCAISLALLENGQPVYGIVYDMARRVLMHGGPGFGMWDGEREARVKAASPDANAMLGFHSPYDKVFAPHAAILVENFKLRGLGSSTLHLAYVGAGLLDATVDHNVRIWDIAAAVPLVWAAGGEVQFLNGEQFPLRDFNLRMKRIQFIAGNAAACARLRELLNV